MKMYKGKECPYFKHFGFWLLQQMPSQALEVQLHCRPRLVVSKVALRSGVHRCWYQRGLQGYYLSHHFCKTAARGFYAQVTWIQSEFQDRALLLWWWWHLVPACLISPKESADFKLAPKEMLMWAELWKSVVEPQSSTSGSHPETTYKFNLCILQNRKWRARRLTQAKMRLMAAYKQALKTFRKTKVTYW